MVSFSVRRHYDPLSSSLSMITQEGSTVQNYDVYNKEYIPDRRIRPTAILPECRISDPAEILEAGVVNRYLTDIIWYQGEMKPENIILDTDKDFKIDRSSNTNNRGRITVYKNVPFGAPLTLSFSATFVDMVGNNVRRRAYFNGFVYLTSSSFADAPLTFIPFCPRGDTFNPLSGMTCLPLCGDLKAGNELIPQAHWWYRKTASGLNLLGSEYEGYKSREIKIPTSEIGKDAHYVCRIKDCRHDLADLQETYLQEELDKISDYPRNLLAKQYFLDLNDEIKPGVVTEGEDADGKYICIPSPSVLYAYVGKTEQRDLFSGKMSFKENTVYNLRVVGKHVSETESQWGFAFMIAYTDGTISYAKFGDNANKKREFVIKSTPNKTISHISSTYGFEIPSYIYGIQITEEYNYNLLEGDTEEVTINIEDNGTNSDNYKLAARNISKSLNAGNKVTVSIGDVVNLKGESTEYTVLIYQIKESGNQSVGSVLSASKKTSILTIPSSFNSADPCVLYLYAGKSGATAGNSVKYNSVQLIEGEYAWNVLGEDVEEVTVEAGEKENARSGILIPNKLTVGGKYTIVVDDIVNLKGEETEYTVLVRQNRESSIPISDTISISQNKKNAIITINDQYQDGDYETILYVYAGQAGSTAGNIVQFKNIRLLQGGTVLPSVPAYTPHFIPSAPDIEVESERITLPEGYRPDGEPTNYEEYDYTLTTAYPPEKWKICTPYGSSDEGLIDIPSDVQLFPAWAEIRTSEGVVEDPGKYYSMDWGNGKKGINILMDASELSTDLLTLNPVLYRGLEYVKYAASGINLPFNNIEDFVEGSRIVLEIPPNTPNKNAYISFRKDGFGLLIMYNVNGNVSLFIYGYNKRMSTIIKYVESVILRYELLIGATLEECQLFLNSGPYTGSFGNIENGGGNSFNIDVNSRVSLVEIYSPENVLLHKWDFEGDTDDERLSDKAETENKVNFSKSDGFEFIPV